MEKYKSIYPIGEEIILIPYEENRKWGYIDLVGNEIMKPTFDQATYFSESLASVKIAGNWGYINPKGELIIKPQFETAGPFYRGVAIVNDRVRYKLIT